MNDKLLRKFCGDTRRYLFQAVAMQCLKLVGSLAFSFAIAGALTVFFGNKATSLLSGTGLTYLLLSVVALLILLGLRFLAARESTKAQAKVIAEVKLSLRRALLDKLFRLGPSYHRKHPTQAVVHLGVEGVEQLENYFGAYLVQLYYCLLAAVLVFLALAPFAWQPALLLLCLSPVIPLFLALILRMVRRIQKRQWQSFTDVGTLFLESIQGLTTLKLFGAGEARGKLMADQAESFRRSTMRVLAMQLNSITIIDIIAYGSIAGGFALAVSLYLAGKITLFAFFLSVLLAAEFFLPMRALTSLFHVAMLGVAAGHEMVDFLEEAEPARTRTTAFPEGKDLVITDLSYRYPDADTNALNHVSLTLESGKLTALVGLSGCGKSTLAAWLAGEIDDPDWLKAVRVGDVPGSELAGPQWQQAVVRMSHESHIFQGSVRDNLLMGRPEATDEELVAVLKQVQLWEMFASREGLDTPLSGENKSLSGGQAQRLALARVLLKDCALYIFDEATSNVDVASEAILLREMEALAARKTVLLISHRLDTLTHAARIYLMEEGRIEDGGSYEELVSRSETFRNWLQEQKELLAESKLDQASFEEALEGANTATDEARREVRSQSASTGPSNSGASDNSETEKHGRLRSGPQVMLELIGLITPLIGWVLAAIVFGVFGFLTAFGLAILPLYALFAALPGDLLANLPGGGFSSGSYLGALAFCAVARAVLHYLEQYCNHNIAFKLLATIRNRVYAVVHRLAPAKLDEANPGRLLAVLLGDIELLEVFYAHTLSPIAIAALTAVALAIYFFSLHPLIGVLALVWQVIIGVLLPWKASHHGSPVSRQIRGEIGGLNALFLDRLRGLRELIQFGLERDTTTRVSEATRELGKKQTRLRLQASRLLAGVESLIQLAGISQVLLTLWLLTTGAITAPAAVLAIVMQISSFAPFVALASLGNTLTQTFACGNRVLNLLEEEPVVRENPNGHTGSFGELKADALSFRYPGSPAGLLQNCGFTLRPGERVGICGRSGCGKSTLLKLLMRFRDPDEGRITLDSVALPDWNTAALYSHFGYLTQQAHLFTGTLRENLLLAKPDASEEELWQCLDAVGLRSRITQGGGSLDVRIGENGENFSGGERQRMGLARCLLAGRDLLLLDEPTSNLDVLNEAAVLRALKNLRPDQSLILVSHRLSTLSLCDRILFMEDGHFTKSHGGEA